MRNQNSLDTICAALATLIDIEPLRMATEIIVSDKYDFL